MHSRCVSPIKRPKCEYDRAFFPLARQIGANSCAVGLSSGFQLHENNLIKYAVDRPEHICAHSSKPMETWTIAILSAAGTNQLKRNAHTHGPCIVDLECYAAANMELMREHLMWSSARTHCSEMCVPTATTSSSREIYSSHYFLFYRTVELLAVRWFSLDVLVNPVQCTPLHRAQLRCACCIHMHSVSCSQRAPSSMDLGYCLHCFAYKSYIYSFSLSGGIWRASCSCVPIVQSRRLAPKYTIAILCTSFPNYTQYARCSLYFGALFVKQTRCFLRDAGERWLIYDSQIHRKQIATCAWKNKHNFHELKQQKWQPLRHIPKLNRSVNIDGKLCYNIMWIFSYGAFVDLFYSTVR